jgi:hypothetical protein
MGVSIEGRLTIVIRRLGYYLRRDSNSPLTANLEAQ